MNIYDDRACTLGEGPLWHPERQELFWFDILGKRLLSKARSWDFEEHVSAAGWLGQDRLLIASETALWDFDLGTGKQSKVVELEADNPVTRSNDGRADPYGGLWIGTMGKSGEDQAGAIYRYYRGEVRTLYDNITVSNAMCFSPDGLWAYFCDTRSYYIQKVRLDETHGWPVGEPEVFIDLRADQLKPDGAVIDSTGRLWCAQFGAGRVACYDGSKFSHAFDIPATQTTCPAFGGDDLKTLFVTTAARGLDAEHAGKTFSIDVDVAGQAEHQVIL